MGEALNLITAALNWTEPTRLGPPGAKYLTAQVRTWGPGYTAASTARYQIEITGSSALTLDNG